MTSTDSASASVLHHPTIIHERVALAQQGKNETVIGKLRSGWAVLGDSQFFFGYSLLLADPVVPSLNDLEPKSRLIFLEDMGFLGEALLRVLTPRGALRINYEILGNLDPALHAHLFPRYSSEPEELLKGPVYYYPRSERRSVPFDGRVHQELKESLQAELARMSVLVW